MPACGAITLILAAEKTCFPEALQAADVLLKCRASRDWCTNSMWNEALRPQTCPGEKMSKKQVPPVKKKVRTTLVKKRVKCRASKQGEGREKSWWWSRTMCNGAEPVPPLLHSGGWTVFFVAFVRILFPLLQSLTLYLFTLKHVFSDNTTLYPILYLFHLLLNSGKTEADKI